MEYMPNRYLNNLELYIKEYGDLLNPEAIIKEDILRQGVFFERIVHNENFSGKSYFIFSFDVDNDNDIATRKYPEEIALQNGIYNLKRTIISVRINKSSPYKIKFDQSKDKYVLFLDGAFIGDIVFSPEKSYMLKTTSTGKSVRDIAPTIEWGYLIYLAVFRMCQYFENNNECAFCDMRSNYVTQKKTHKDYSAVKSIDDIIDALGLINASKDSVSKAYTLTGGSIVDGAEFKGDAEIDFYVPFLEAIEDKYKGKWISKVVVQAHDIKKLKRLKDAGAFIYHTNFEVWDRELFDNICPGKSLFIGRDEWIKRIVDAVSIFGEYRVIPNFVAGVELSKPYGFSNIDDAINSTAEGLEFFMSNSVIPRYTTWCPEKTSKLGKLGNSSVPLEYYVKLLLKWHELHYKYGLPIPEGYGEAGPGKAEFSVSAFMDAFKIKGDA